MSLKRKSHAPLTPSIAALMTGLAATSYTSGVEVWDPKTLSATSKHQEDQLHGGKKKKGTRISAFSFLLTVKNNDHSIFKLRSSGDNTKRICSCWIILIPHNFISIRVPSNLVPSLKLPLATNTIVKVKRIHRIANNQTTRFPHQQRP